MIKNTFWKYSVFSALFIIGCGGGGGATNPVDSSPTNTSSATSSTADSSSDRTGEEIDKNSDSYKVAFQHLVDFMRTIPGNTEARKRINIDDFQNLGLNMIDTPEKLLAILLGIQGRLLNDPSTEYAIPITQKAIYFAGLDLYINEPAETFIFKGLEYAIITSEQTGKRWLDRNLGAKRPCLWYRATDTACWGNFYQWGRPADGHEILINHFRKDDKEQWWKTTKEKPTGIKPGHGMMIVGDDSPIQDWTYGDRDGSKRSAFWKKSDGTGVCPKGFRVPTSKEFFAELRDHYNGYIHQPDLPYFERLRNFLRVPLNPRQGKYSIVRNRGGSLAISEGNLWTTDVADTLLHGSKGFYSYITETTAGGIVGVKATNPSNAAGIRCIEN